jgi:hypothetical protein
VPATNRNTGRSHHGGSEAIVVLNASNGLREFGRGLRNLKIARRVQPEALDASRGTHEGHANCGGLKGLDARPPSGSDRHHQNACMPERDGWVFDDARDNGIWIRRSSASHPFRRVATDKNQLRRAARGPDCGHD